MRKGRSEGPEGRVQSDKDKVKEVRRGGGGEVRGGRKGERNEERMGKGKK